MPDIFQDVDEALRREKIENLWRTHGGLIVAAIAALLAGTAGYSFYKNWRASQAVAQTDAFWAAQGAQDPAQALERLPSEKTAPGLRGLALLTAAGLALDKGSAAQARDHYDALAADRTLDPLMSDYAAVAAARLSADSAVPATATPTERLARLDAVIAKKDSPWAGPARIAAAVLCAGPLQDPARARTYLAPLLAAGNRTQGFDAPPAALADMAARLDHVYALSLEATNAP